MRSFRKTRKGNGFVYLLVGRVPINNITCTRSTHCCRLCVSLLYTNSKFGFMRGHRREVICTLYSTVSISEQYFYFDSLPLRSFLYSTLKSSSKMMYCNDDFAIFLYFVPGVCCSLLQRRAWRSASGRRTGGRVALC
jgi:hypothetical protein